MTRLYNSENAFREEFLDGLVSAYNRFLRPIEGASAVASIVAPQPGRVSVIIGGGAGHYPAFAGLVGPGLCDGAVVGEIFTSPSAESAYRCIKALDGGGGVLLSFGNYSGDVMHFGLAAQRARHEGIDVRIVLVTDDVASAPAERAASRRGVAGGFFVFRAASGAAHEHKGLDEVERIARAVNDSTFTFGVAFDGCTFPGRSDPLFRVPADHMDLGLGIHGEPGIDTVPWMPADEIATLLVRRLLAEKPAGSDRALVLLNGLGSTKYEELFVLYRSIATRLADAGVEAVEPEVGEFVTSLDMAGCSLSLCWLTDEIEPWLTRPAAAPGFHSGSMTHHRITVASPAPLRIHDDKPRPATVPEPLPVAQTASAECVTAMLKSMADAIEGAVDELGRLDSVAGDGDHGVGMSRGMRAAATAAAHSGLDAADVLIKAGFAFSDAAGGASGALWGAGLCGAGEWLSAQAGPLEPPIVHGAVKAAVQAVAELGGAKAGDKTMLDAMIPFVDALAEPHPAGVADTWTAAAQAATVAAGRTADLRSAKGRSAVHGERTIGAPDPGAVSFALAVTAAGNVLREKR